MTYVVGYGYGGGSTSGGSSGSGYTATSTGGFGGGYTGSGTSGSIVTQTSNQVSTNHVTYVQKQTECTALKLCMQTCETGYQLGKVGTDGCRECICPPKKTYVYGKITDVLCHKL